MTDSLWGGGALKYEERQEAPFPVLPSFSHKIIDPSVSQALGEVRLGPTKLQSPHYCIDPPSALQRFFSKSITDFFKPFAFPRQNKRPLPTDQSEEPRPSQRSRSTTPTAEDAAGELINTSSEYKDTRITSSQSSVLSSLESSTVRGLDDLPSQNHALPVRDFRDDHSVQSIAGNGQDQQVPIFSSSQRVVRNGEVIIKDSDDERSDSDISLENLEDLIAPHKRSLEPSSHSEHDNSTLSPPIRTRSRAGRSLRKGARNSTLAAAANTPSTSTALPRYKFSLDALIKQSKNDVDSQAKIRNAKDLLEGLEERKAAPHGTDAPKLDDLLAAVIGDQHEDGGPGVEGLKAAMERTEALYQDRIWSFFDTKQEYQDLEPVTCPPVADPYWRDIFGEPATRQQAFLSGYVGECASLRKLPEELLFWLLDSDRNILNDCTLVYIIEAVISTILGHLDGESDAELSNFSQTICASVKDPCMQLSLLRHLPSSSSPQSLLRRRLALAFFFNDRMFLKKEIERLINLKTITRHLYRPQFAISRGTDYASLAASIGILVIGLDNADPPPVHAGANTVAAFNANIDMLAVRIHEMFAHIKDAGATYRKRTEAKEVLEWFGTCLSSALRTQPKPKGMIWGDDVGIEKQRNIMKGFFQKDRSARSLNGDQ
ncbi:MAG: hypothetical protein Q9218_002758 [Villophora microphyllina]